jgi:hypothetical protein
MGKRKKEYYEKTDETFNAQIWVKLGYKKGV